MPGWWTSVYKPHKQKRVTCIRDRAAALSSLEDVLQRGFFGSGFVPCSLISLDTASFPQDNANYKSQRWMQEYLPILRALLYGDQLVSPSKGIQKNRVKEMPLKWDWTRPVALSPLKTHFGDLPSWNPGAVPWETQTTRKWCEDALIDMAGSFQTPASRASRHSHIGDLSAGGPGVMQCTHAP